MSLPGLYLMGLFSSRVEAYEQVGAYEDVGSRYVSTDEHYEPDEMAELDSECLLTLKEAATSSYIRRNALPFIVELVNPWDDSAYYPTTLNPDVLMSSVQDKTKTQTKIRTSTLFHPLEFLNQIKEDFSLCFQATKGTLRTLRATPHDEELRQWILGQPDRSLTPEVLLSKALEFAGGDVATALLASHNVIASIRTVGVDVMLEDGESYPREKTALALKLKLISQYEGRETYDNIGPLYHFFASAYCAYMINQPTLLKAGVLLEDTGSQFKEPWDPIERYAGNLGVDFGCQFRKTAAQ